MEKAVARKYRKLTAWVTIRMENIIPYVQLLEMR